MKGRGTVDRCASWTKHVRTALGRAASNKQKYLHIACFKKERVVDLSNRSAWFDQVKVWLSMENCVVAVGGERDCSDAYKWSIFLEEAVTDRVGMELKAEWYVSNEVCEIDEDTLTNAVREKPNDDDDAVKSIVTSILETV